MMGSIMRTLLSTFLFALAFVAPAQDKKLSCDCYPAIESTDLDTTADYILEAFSFAGTVSRNRGDELREGFKLEAGMKVRPTLGWVRQLGFCGDGRYCLEKARFILNEEEPDRVRIQLFMVDVRKRK